MEISCESKTEKKRKTKREKRASDFSKMRFPVFFSSKRFYISNPLGASGQKPEQNKIQRTHVAGVARKKRWPVLQRHQSQSRSLRWTSNKIRRIFSTRKALGQSIVNTRRSLRFRSRAELHSDRFACRIAALATSAYCTECQKCPTFQAFRVLAK